MWNPPSAFLTRPRTFREETEFLHEIDEEYDETMRNRNLTVVSTRGYAHLSS